MTLVAQVIASSARERVFHVAVAHLVGLLILSPWVADLTLGAPTRAVRDLGLTTSWALASVVAVWLGIRHVGGDLRARTAALLLLRVSRTRWLLARSAGIALVLAIEVLLLVGGFAIAAGPARLPPLGGMLAFTVLLWAEACVIAATSMLLGTLARPAFAATCAIALWAAGHLAEEYAKVAGLVLPTAVYALIPDLDLFVVQAELVHDLPLPIGRIGAALAYAGLWCVVLGSATGVVVERGDAA